MLTQEVDKHFFPFDVIDDNEGSNSMRITGSVVSLGLPDEPVRDKWPNWLSAQLLVGGDGYTNNHEELEYVRRDSFAVKADKDGTLWWFDNHIEHNPFRGLGNMYRPYVHSDMDVEGRNHIGLIKQVTMCCTLGKSIHFPVGHKVSFVPMRPHQLHCNADGKPLVLHKNYDEADDMTWPLTLPIRTVGVATEIIQDLPIHQPTKLTRKGPVLEFRRHSRRLPTSVSQA